jgi:bis(5'-nucleosyl)-tetraphosphatase (symmetrical)
MAIYAIGDIQGCYDQLCRLLDKLAFDPSKDCIWALGDLVNRGKSSLAVLRLLKRLGSSFKTVLGNHDLHLIGVYSGLRAMQSGDTLDEIINATDADELINWLRYQSLFIHDAKRNLSLVHAGIPPHWSIKKTLLEASFLENLLQGENYIDQLKTLYEAPPSNLSVANTDDCERIKWTAAYLTRMRLCDNKGNLCFNTVKSNLAKQGFLPWFLFPQSLQKGTIIFGHWAALEGKTNIANIHALDTGCVWGKQLTAVNIDTFHKVSVNFD